MKITLWTALVVVILLGLGKAIGVWPVVIFIGFGLVIGLLVQRYLLFGARILIERILLRFLSDMAQHESGRQYIGFKSKSYKEPETFVRIAVKLARDASLIRAVSITTDDLYHLYEITEQGREFVRERASK